MVSPGDCLSHRKTASGTWAPLSAILPVQPPSELTPYTVGAPVTCPRRWASAADTGISKAIGYDFVVSFIVHRPRYVRIPYTQAFRLRSFPFSTSQNYNWDAKSVLGSVTPRHSWDGNRATHHLGLLTRIFASGVAGSFGFPHQLGFHRSWKRRRGWGNGICACHVQSVVGDTLVARNHVHKCNSASTAPHCRCKEREIYWNEEKEKRQKKKKATESKCSLWLLTLSSRKEKYYDFKWLPMLRNIQTAIRQMNLE